MLESMTLIKVGKKARTLFNCNPNEESGLVEKPLPIEIKITDFPDPSIYNLEVFGIYGSYAYLDALSKTSGDLGKFLYPQIYLEGKLIAAGCFQELHLNREKLNELGRLFSADSSWTIRLEGMLKGLLGAKSKSLKVLIAGNCQVSGPYGLFYTAAVSELEQLKVWQQMIQFIERELDPYSILLVKDLNGKSDQMDSSWCRAGFTATQALPLHQMELLPEWSSFSESLSQQST